MLVSEVIFGAGPILVLALLLRLAFRRKLNAQSGLISVVAAGVLALIIRGFMDGEVDAATRAANIFSSVNIQLVALQTIAALAFTMFYIARHYYKQP